MRNLFLRIAIICPIFAGCTSEIEPATPMQELTSKTSESIPDTIVAVWSGFVPESVDYDAVNGRFLTGSLSSSSVFQIHNDGRVTTMTNDPDLGASRGIEVDEPRGRLLVAGVAKLGVYDLATGGRIAMVDLATLADGPSDYAPHLTDDVAVADDGTAYVTDSQKSVIYRIGVNHEVSVLHQFKPIRGLRLNSVVYHPSGYLLVAGGPTLWKVPLDDPTTTMRVVLPEEIPGQDGIVWTANGRLAIVSGTDDSVVALTSRDDWVTAQTAGIAKYQAHATAVAAVGDDLYVIHPHYADMDPPSLERVNFE